MELLGGAIDWIGNAAEIFWEFVKAHQSLTAGLLALLAAYVAARPVWKQLHVLTRQAEFQSRDIITLKITQLTSIADKFEKEVSELGTHLRLAQNIYHGYEEEPEPIDPHAAHGLELEMHSLVARMTKLLNDRDLPGDSDDDLSEAISNAKTLGRTLGRIHAPASVDFGDPDYGIDDPKKAERDAITDSKKALTEVNDHFDDFQSAIGNVISKITCHSQSLRRRLREIEAKLL